MQKISSTSTENVQQRFHFCAPLWPWMLINIIQTERKMLISVLNTLMQSLKDTDSRTFEYKQTFKYFGTIN